MNSDALVPVPRTAVPLGIADPVVQARTELKAALAAIEEKANVPRRVGRALDRGIDRARAFQRRDPALAAAAVIVAAVAVGAAVWGVVRLYTR
jgi:hypothetical protein